MSGTLRVIGATHYLILLGDLEIRLRVSDWRVYL